MRSTDALIRVTRAAICGSDLWPYVLMERSDTGCQRGHEFIGGGQSEAVRVPFADGTLVVLPGDCDDELLSLLALSDVMGTGHHAAVRAGVVPGGKVVVVGDGAVGLCGVIEVIPEQNP